MKPARSKRTALVVDDDPPSRLLLTEVLEYRGLRVFALSDATDAVQLATAGGFCAVFMDWRLPGVDGLEATRRIRAAERTQGLPAIPIIATTASAMDAEVHQCLAAGVSEVITKPLDFDRVALAVTRWCPD